MTDAGPLDILHDIPDREGARLGYDELNNRATTHTYVGGVTVRVAALDDIVASKQWANRLKDHKALPELEALQRAAGHALGREQAHQTTTSRHSRVARRWLRYDSILDAV
jgi:hypothetical protein